MRIIAIITALVTGAGAAWAQCDVPAPTKAASGWTTDRRGDAWVALHPAHPGLEVEVFMHAPGSPRVLDWAIPGRYSGRIGVLQYYAGEPGTSHLVTLVHNAIVDLQTGRTLGDAEFSADCELALWDWQDHRIVVDSAGYGEVVIDLP